VIRRRTLLFSALILFLALAFLFKDSANEYRIIKKLELQRRITPRLSAFLDHPIPFIRKAAFRAFYRIGHAHGASRYWAAFLEEKDPYIKNEALFGLRYFPALKPKLFQLLSEEPPENISLFYETFFFMAGPKDISLLFELLGTDERTDDVLFTALGNMAHSLDFSAEDKEEARSALLSLLGPELSRAYAYALSQWGIPPSREKDLPGLITLEDILRDYYYMSLLHDENSLKALLHDFDRFPALLKFRYLTQCARYPALRDFLYQRSLSSLELLPLLENENRLSLLKEYASPSYPSYLRETSFYGMLFRNKAGLDLINTFKDDALFLRAFSRNPDNYFFLLTPEWEQRLLGQNDHITRRNTYDALSRLHPGRKKEFAQAALEDPDFTVRLTGYLLLQDEPALFQKTLLNRYPEEPVRDLRYFLFDLIRQEGEKELTDKLLALEKDPELLSLMKQDTPPPFPKYRNRNWVILFRTAKGDIIMECFGDEAPHTVENIIRLVKGGFYSGISFHRVALNHVIQAGDPHGDGWGGSFPLIKAEYSPLSYREPGMVGIADRGKDTGSSQFFITLAPRPHLDGRYTLFAKIIKGMDTVYRIEPGDTIIEARILASKERL